MWYQPHFDIVTLQIYNQTEDKEMPCLFLYKADMVIDQAKCDEAVAIKVAGVDARDAAAKVGARKTVEWEFYSNYLLARLKLPDTSNPFPINEMRNKLPELTPRTEKVMPFLAKLSGDCFKHVAGSGEFDSLMIARPNNLEAPPNVPKEMEISEDDFKKTFAEFQERAAHATMSRADAEKMQKLMAMSINAFANAEQDATRRKAMTKQQRMWLSMFTRWIVRMQVNEVRKVLDVSAAYKVYTDSQEAKRKAAKEGGALPAI